MIVVCFGRPGAGKTTILNKALELFEFENRIVNSVDLDVCIPQAMKDNFAKGIYPTLEQREIFAHTACDYVQEKRNCYDESTPIIISFSFVNTDLRTIFMSRFPEATWVLIDVSERTAQSRIDSRLGHFYKGNLKSPIAQDDHPKRITKDNAEWEFAPVDFDHISLDGLKPIEENARHLANVVINAKGSWIQP